MTTLGLSAGIANASDGVLEINQTCAVQTGCFPGDTAGFPVTITEADRRSYRLTSDLVVPLPSNTGIYLHISSATLDLGGFVFGEADPEPRTVEIDLFAGQPYGMDGPVFGETTVEIAADGTFTMSALDVPGDRIKSEVITGQLLPGLLTATFVIEFEDGGGAEGEIDVARG